MIKNFKQYNESLTDKMTPKSDEEVNDARIKALGFNTQEELDKAIKGDGIDKVYDVYSGLDAFVYDNVELDNGEKIYSQYISVIATSPLDARIKTAKIIGQELYDQDINPNYENWVSDHVVFKYNF
jgi:hypothetical protein